MFILIMRTSNTGRFKTSWKQMHSVLKEPTPKNPVTVPPAPTCCFRCGLELLVLRNQGVPLCPPGHHPLQPWWDLQVTLRGYMGDQTGTERASHTKKGSKNKLLIHSCILSEL